jgi:hypothetical protein
MIFDLLIVYAVAAMACAIALGFGASREATTQDILIAASIWPLTLFKFITK